jgi:pimeloyl-ACP methyl ester carboxylesterase
MNGSFDPTRSRSAWSSVVEILQSGLASPAETVARKAIGSCSGRAVVVDGVSLAFEDQGHGPAIVCLHAIGHGSRDFERLVAELHVDFRVIALDWPGHGASGPDHRPVSLRRYADLLEGFLDRIGIVRSVLVGNSIGGGAALLFAARHPARVSRLVLENAAGLTPINARARRFLRAMTRWFARGADGARWFPLAFAVYYQLVLTEPAANDQRRRIIAAGKEHAALLSEAWQSFGSPDSDLRELVRDLDVPTLVVWATKDRLNAFHRVRPALETLRHVRIEKLPVGHSPHLEAYPQFERILREFLRSRTA